MSEVPPPAAPTHGNGPVQRRSGLSTTAKVLFFVLLPIIIALALVAVVLSSVLFNGAQVGRSETLRARSEVVVDVAGAALHFAPGAGDEVRVRMTGFSLGPEPELITSDSGDSTTISGGCRSSWFAQCRLTVTVTMPADVPLTVEGRNGSVEVDGLRGTLALRTTNGAIQVSDSVGRVRAETTNGAITVEDTKSPRVDVSTTNGRISLEFEQSPVRVEARSTNGAVAITLPVDGYEYTLDLDTVNGQVETNGIPTDNDSHRSVTARTTNGSVTLRSSDE